jgi:hypothetical protein
MTVETYSGLYQFNAAIHQALLSLDTVTHSGSFSKVEMSRFAEFLTEVSAATNSYIASIIEEHETREAGALFRRRRKGEMSEE